MEADTTQESIRGPVWASSRFQSHVVSSCAWNDVNRIPLNCLPLKTLACLLLPYLFYYVFTAAVLFFRNGNDAQVQELNFNSSFGWNEIH